MDKTTRLTKIAIIGGGPAALFMFKRLVESGINNLHISIFERKQILGAGMPYSTEGANEEHVTNVSDNEIPKIVCSVEEWLEMAPRDTLDRFHIHKENFNEFKVLPRLFFGEYLSGQFDLLSQQAEAAEIMVDYNLGCNVLDITYDKNQEMVTVELAKGNIQTFDKVIICTGHNWPKKFEGRVPGYFDSPYPPSKLLPIVNKKIAIRGSSLTAIDAIRTLARNNGTFSKDNDGKVSYQSNENAAEFKMVMHSRSGLLPAVRFHLDDSHLGSDFVLSKDDIRAYKDQHDGFVSLDYLFEMNFKELIRRKDAAFYEKICHLNIEGFVDLMMELRERIDPFVLLRSEYAEAQKSMMRHRSIYWKEALAILSFSMNYPAKYLPAEDMLRLQKTLMPLISIVIAFIPQKSCEELLALHDAGVLDIVSVGSDGEVVPDRAGGVTYDFIDDDGVKRTEYYNIFVDCIGQPHLSYDDFPFAGLLHSTVINPARLKFKSEASAIEEIRNGNDKISQSESGEYFLRVSGIAINDNFQVLDNYGAYNDNVYIMAVPYIGGFNPDYSGLDFCEEASGRIVESILQQSDN